MKALVLAEHDYFELSSATLSVLAAALKLELPVHVLVVGNDCATVVDSVARIAGVSKVLCAQASYYAQPTSENLAELLHGLAPHYTYVMTAASVQGKAVLPRLAAMLDLAPVSDINRIVDRNTFERHTHAGNLLATVQCNESILLLSICPSFFKPVHEAQKATQIEQIPPASDTGLSCVELRDNPPTIEGKPSLANARVVVGGGKGFDSVEDFYKLLNPLADQLHAALGATRALVDAGVPNSMQIGQSGLSIAPDLYFAIGLSGAIQHLSGIKNSKCIVAINRGSREPICQHADYILLGDLVKIIPELTEAFKNSI
jgi:electron transfer flavoprotein alpha subunit